MGQLADAHSEPGPGQDEGEDAGLDDDAIADRELAAAMRLADVAMASSERVLNRVGEHPTERSPLVYDQH
jgi:hypothetical protein